MGLFKQGIEYLTDSPFNIKAPIFIKEFSKESQQLNKLEDVSSKVSEEEKKYIEKDIKMIRAGLEGEQKVYFELKNSFLPIVCLHDVRLVYKTYVAQLDYVVITPVNICILECKKLMGDIEVTNKGDFIRYIKDYKGKLIKKEGMYSPITQNERHIDILTEFLREQLGYKVRDSLLKNIVVIADPKTVINDKFAPKHIKEQIIKYDQLKIKISESIEHGKDKNLLLKSDMNKIAEHLMAYHEPLVMDYSKKYIIKPDEQISNKSDAEVVEEVEGKDLYEKLKAYRLKQSKQEQVKPYFIFNNSQLENLVAVKPNTLEKLIAIQGFGEVKCQRYGQDIVDIIKEFK